MATKKQQNAEEMLDVFLNVMDSIRDYRQRNANNLTERQNRLLDSLSIDGMKLVQISIIMPPKKKDEFLVSNLINGIKYNLSIILGSNEMNCMNPLYGSFAVFISVAKEILDNYLH